jgi:hypothetical protein
MHSLLFLLVACTTKASVGIDEEGLDDGTGDTDPAGDTDDTAPPASEYAGTYDGTVVLSIPEYDWDVCEGDIEITVADDASLVGSGVCRGESWDGNAYDLAVDVTGVVDEAGGVTGDAMFEFLGRPGETIDLEADVSGEVSGAEMTLAWTAQTEFGGGPMGGETVDVDGEVDATAR